MKEVVKYKTEEVINVGSVKSSDFLGIQDRKLGKAVGIITDNSEVIELGWGPDKASIDCPCIEDYLSEALEQGFKVFAFEDFDEAVKWYLS